MLSFFPLLEVFLTSERIIQLILLGLCFAVSWTDIRERRIPNLALLIGFALMLAVRLLLGKDWSWLSSIPFGAVVLFCFGGIALIWPASLGMGDVKLLSCAAYALGVGPFFMVLTITSMTALLGAGILLLRNQTSRTQSLPYAPFVSVGFLLWFVFSHWE